MGFWTELNEKTTFLAVVVALDIAIGVLFNMQTALLVCKTWPYTILISVHWLVDRTKEGHHHKGSKVRIRKGLGVGGNQSHIAVVSHSVFTPRKSLLNDEEYSVSSISKRGTLEVMNQDGEQMCHEDAVPIVVDSCSSLERVLD